MRILTLASLFALVSGPTPALAQTAPTWQLLVTSQEILDHGALTVPGSQIIEVDDKIYISYPRNGPLTGAGVHGQILIFVEQYDRLTSQWSPSADPGIVSLAPQDPSHESTALILDGNDELHLWGGMHYTPMQYNRTLPQVINQWSDDVFPAQTDFEYTYPEAARCPVTGDVFFVARGGSSQSGTCSTYTDAGFGIQLYHYSVATGSWQVVGEVFSGCKDIPQEDGKTYYVYHPGLVVDSHGDVHISVIWQIFENATVGRAQGTYVRYDPGGGGFYKADGTDVTDSMPITTLDRDAVWQWQPRVLNWEAVEITGKPVIAVDSTDRPVVGYGYSPIREEDAKAEEEDPKNYVYRVAAWDGSEWVRSSLNMSAGKFFSTFVKSGGGRLRAYFRDRTPGAGNAITAHQATYNGSLWGEPHAMWAGLIRSLSTVSDTTDIAYYDAEVYEMSFGLPASPLVSEIAPNADTYIRGGIYANDNYGTEGGIVVRNFGGGNNVTREGLLRFDLGGLSPARIQRARVRLFCNGLWSSPSSVSLAEVSDDTWDESTVTWNTAPSYSTPVTATAHIGASGHAYDWDVTDYIRSEAQGDDEASFAVVGAPINIGFGFNTKEALSGQPVLEVISYIPPTSSETTIAPIDDAVVRAGSFADTVNGPGADLIVKDDGGEEFDRRSYLKFDLTGLSNRHVSRALLRVYNNAQFGDSEIDISVSSAEGDPVTDPTGDAWSESTITWNNAPVPDLGLDAILVTDDRQYFEFDVTPLINRERQGDGTATIIIHRANVDNATSVEFDSLEAGSTPELRITYVL